MMPSTPFDPAPRGPRLKRHGLAFGLMTLVLLAACDTTPRRAPPVVDRNVGRPQPPVAGSPRPAAPVAGEPQAGDSDVATATPLGSPSSVKPQPPGWENAGKPGYFTVRPGDTLIRIALENGQNWRDIARWNNLTDPNRLEVGQVLRVLPPGSGAIALVTPPPAAPGLTAPGGALPAPAASGSSAPAAASAVPAAPAATPAGDDEPVWIWPASGPVLAGFDDARNKGLAIGGKAGDPVLAAADGRVVYAGAGLRGYGNLVIVKHNASYLSAYAHNQNLLVKEDQPVRKGQRIADMGSSDAERVQLHFEIRRMGKPVDPGRLLPAR